MGLTIRESGTVARRGEFRTVELFILRLGTVELVIREFGTVRARHLRIRHHGLVIREFGTVLTISGFDASSSASSAMWSSSSASSAP